MSVPDAEIKIPASKLPFTKIRVHPGFMCFFKINILIQF